MNNPFWEQQQRLFKLWNGGLEAGKFPGMETYQKLYKAMMPGVAEYWDKVAQMAPGVGSYWKNLSQGTAGSDAFAKGWAVPIPGMELYTKVFDLWKGLGDPITFAQDYQEKYNDVMQDFFQSVLPTNASQFFAKPYELTQACVNLYKEVFSPWMELDPALMERVAAGDQNAYVDFFKELQSKYDHTFNKVFNMMGMGLNRESNEDYMQAINAYYKMLFACGELVALVSQAGSSGMQALLERYRANLQEGKMITTFREFYNLWYQVNEDILLKLFNTDEFSKAFGEFADKYAKYMIAANKICERLLAPLPIPTKKDMDSLYLTVYEQRKAIRDINREMEALKAALEQK